MAKKLTKEQIERLKNQTPPEAELDDIPTDRTEDPIESERKALKNEPPSWMSSSQKKDEGLNEYTAKQRAKRKAFAPFKKK